MEVVQFVRVVVVAENLVGVNKGSRSKGEGKCSLEHPL
jgi:hypothetical protein